MHGLYSWALAGIKSCQVARHLMAAAALASPAGGVTHSHVTRTLCCAAADRKCQHGLQSSGTARWCSLKHVPMTAAWRCFVECFVM